MKQLTPRQGINGMPIAYIVPQDQKTDEDADATGNVRCGSGGSWFNDLTRQYRTSLNVHEVS